MEQNELLFYGKEIVRHKKFWFHEKSDRPLLECYIGLYASDNLPSTMESLPNGKLLPENIDTDAFLKDCDYLYEVHREINDDYPFVGSPIFFIPWMEAIMGCPIISSRNSIWAQKCIDNINSWSWDTQLLYNNLWLNKLLEIMKSLIKHSNGKYTLSNTMMRGPLDILAAMRGIDKLLLDFFDYAQKVKEALAFCTDVFVKVGKAQLDMIPDSKNGYMPGHGVSGYGPQIKP